MVCMQISSKFGWSVALQQTCLHPCAGGKQAGTCSVAGYRKMAEKLGGIPLQAWKNTYDREPVATRNICNDVTPAVQHYKQPVIVS